MVNFLIGLATAAIIIAVGVGAIAMSLARERGEPAAPAIAIEGIGADADADVATAEIQTLTLVVRDSADPADLPEYNREHWGDWEDADRDCQDTRQETLIAESVPAVQYEDERGCRVASGRWRGAYAGGTFTNPRDLQVDHMVPLGDAHRSGAWQWSAARKRAYFNYLDYPNHLIAVDGSQNQSKSDDSPDEWKPPLERYHCQYALDWLNIKHRWGLSATRAEVGALREMLAACRAKITLQAALAP